MALAGKVEVVHDEAITAKGSKFRHLVRVEVHLNDGKKMERTVEYARGSEKNFASDAEVVREIREARGGGAAARARRATARCDAQARNIEGCGADCATAGEGVMPALADRSPDK